MSNLEKAKKVLLKTLQDNEKLLEKIKKLDDTEINIFIKKTLEESIERITRVMKELDEKNLNS